MTSTDELGEAYRTRQGIPMIGPYSVNQMDDFYAEALLLLAIKMHDFEATVPHLLAGRTVIEGRSIHSTAVYQSLIMHPDDDQSATASVARILDTDVRWRPLPDLTIVITDDPQAAVHRAEARDRTTVTAGQWGRTPPGRPAVPAPGHHRPRARAPTRPA